MKNIYIIKIESSVWQQTGWNTAIALHIVLIFVSRYICQLHIFIYSPTPVNATPTWTNWGISKLLYQPASLQGIFLGGFWRANIENDWRGLIRYHINPRINDYYDKGENQRVTAAAKHASRGWLIWNMGKYIFKVIGGETRRGIQ